MNTLETKLVTVCFSVKAAIGSIVLNVLILKRYLTLSFLYIFRYTEIVIVEEIFS